MANHFVANAMQVRLLWSIGGNIQMINVLGATKGTALPGQTLANTLGTAIKSAFTSSGLAANVATSVSLANVGVRDYSSASQPEFLDTGAAVPGTGAGDPLPRGVAFVITLRTSLAGQRYRGRVFLGGFTETNNDTTGSAASTIATTGVAFVTAIQTAFAGSGMGLAVLSRPADATQTVITTALPGGGTSTKTKQTVARPGAITPVTAVLARNQVWDEQRRRTLAGHVSTFSAPVAFSELIET